MQIPINEFEQIVDETILKRGVNYYKRGYVIDFSEIATGEYEAIVAGTEDYTVRLTIEDEIINEHQCDCPYYFGPVCKHVAAAIFYFQEHSLQTNEFQQQTTIKKTTSVAQQITALLKDIPQHELIAFIEENCKNDKKFANYFLATFGYLSKNQSKEVCQRQIHSILRTAAGKYGWIDWSEMKHVVNTLMPFLENANRSLKNRNDENVFFITTALLEEVTDAFQFADDSSGDLGYFIESAMALLSELSKQELSEILRKQVFDYCIWSFNTKKFEGWDWHLGILDLAGDLVEKENEADVILGCLDTVSREYEMEQAQSLKLGLLRRFKSEDEVEKYVGQHISNASIRTNEIEKAFKSNDFDRVIQLSEDGIKCDRKDKPGLVKDWYNWLLKAAQAQRHTQKIIEYARFLFIDNFYPQQDYYQILKDHIDAENWGAFLEEIITETSAIKRWDYLDLIRQIYIKEEWWERLFVMLKLNPSMEKIEQNEEYLAKDYTPELIGLYSERILDYVAGSVGRSHYRTACKYLRRMMKLGGNQEVNTLIEFFRKQYPQRKALIDELNQI